MTISVKVIGFYQDGGDGGGTFRVYRDREHYISENTSKYSTPEVLAERWDKAEAGDSPYEEGELDHTEIQIEEVDGIFQLAKGFRLHWGQ